MAHIRQQIRDQARAALIGQTDAGGRVYKSSRTDPIQANQVPAIRVSTPSEESGTASQSGGGSAPLRRETTLRVAGWVAEGDDSDDRLDDLAEQIEIAIAGSGRLGGIAHSVTLGDTLSEIDGDGARRAGWISLDFTVMTTTRENDPSTPI